MFDACKVAYTSPPAPPRSIIQLYPQPRTIALRVYHPPLDLVASPISHHWCWVLGLCACMCAPPCLAAAFTIANRLGLSSGFGVWGSDWIALQRLYCGCVGQQVSVSNNATVSVIAMKLSTHESIIALKPSTCRVRYALGSNNVPQWPSTQWHRARCGRGPYPTHVPSLR